MKFSKVLFTFFVGLFALVIISSCGKDERSIGDIDPSYSLTNPSTDSELCDQPSYEIESYADGADLIEAFLYVEKDYNEVNALDTKEKYYDHYINIDAGNSAATETFDLHGRKYKELGHDGYLDYATDQGLISQDLNTYLKNFRTALTSFMTTNHPSFDDYESYIENEGVVLTNNSLMCAYDKYLAQAYHVTLIGVGKYLYTQHNTSNLKGMSIGLRDGCEDFWEQALCGLGGTVVGIIAGVAVGIWEWGKGVVTGKKGGKDINFLVALYQVYKIAVDMWKIGVAFYEWCCDALGGTEIVECGEPVACYYTPAECGLYTLRIVGPGLYTTTRWANKNTMPEEEITPFPRLDVTIPDPSKISAISGRLICTDEDGSSEKLFGFFQQFDPEDYTYESPAWGYNPPTNAVLNQSYEISVTNPPTDESLYTMAWSSGFGYGITPIGGGINSGAANLIGYSPGAYEIEAIYTHICSGQVQKIGKTVKFN